VEAWVCSLVLVWLCSFLVFVRPAAPSVSNFGGEAGLCMWWLSLYRFASLFRGLLGVFGCPVFRIYAVPFLYSFPFSAVIASCIFRRE